MVGKPRLKKSALQLNQFDGTIIKTLGTFEGTFETNDRFEIIPITVVACIKDHGLLGIDVLKVDTSNLVNSIESEEQEIGLLKGYKASIRLKENYHPRYIPSKTIIHTHFTYCSVKAKKMIQQGILEKVTHGGAIGCHQLSPLKRPMGILQYAMTTKLASTNRYVWIHFSCQVSKPTVMNSQR